MTILTIMMRIGIVLVMTISIQSAFDAFAAGRSQRLKYLEISEEREREREHAENHAENYIEVLLSKQIFSAYIN